MVFELQELQDLIEIYLVEVFIIDGATMKGSSHNDQMDSIRMNSGCLRLETIEIFEEAVELEILCVEPQISIKSDWVWLKQDEYLLVWRWWMTGQMDEGSVTTDTIAARVEITIFVDDVFAVVDFVAEVVNTASAVQRKLQRDR